MKVAVVSESGVDEAVVQALVRAVLPYQVEFTTVRRRAGGVGELLSRFEIIVKQCWYRLAVDGLVCVLDADMTVVHREAASGWEPLSTRTSTVEMCGSECRLCRLRRAWNRLFAARHAPHGVFPVRVALGLAVPSIEAWLLADDPRPVSEVQWIALPSDRKQSLKATLKQRVFGHTLGFDRQEQIASEKIERLLSTCGIERLKDLFPDGLGALIRDLESW